GAVDHDERAGLARAAAVDCPGQHPLAGTFSASDPPPYLPPLPSALRGGLVQVTTSPRAECTTAARPACRRSATDIERKVIPSPSRAFVGALLDYVNEVDAKRGDEVVTVLLPEEGTLSLSHPCKRATGNCPSAVASGIPGAPSGSAGSRVSPVNRC